MLVVIAIIAMLAALVAPQVFRNVGDSRVSAARTQLEMLSTALDGYRLDNGVYPSTEQGLDALARRPSTGDVPVNWRGPYLRRAVPLDPWGHAYVYRLEFHGDQETLVLTSLGRDGRDGGSGEDADIAVSEVVSR